MTNPNTSRVGKINENDLADKINDIAWYHQFEFGNGLVTKTILDLREINEANTRFLDNVDFRGKTVLDVGCWDGYWSFFAERKGAAYVLAIDDLTQRQQDESGFRLAHEIYQSKVEYRSDVSVYELSRVLQQQFDIVLYMGVYYHLTHIMNGFSEVRRVVKSSGEIIVEGGVINDTQRAYTEFYYGDEGNEPYRKTKSNWFMPTRRCLKDMLKCCYFDIVDEFYQSHGSLKKNIRKGIKLMVRKLLEYSQADPVEYGRMLVRAKPVLRSDLNHTHTPPFGLANFDPRYNRDSK